MEAREKAATKPSKHRSQAEKVGRRKYIIKLLHRIERKFERRFDELDTRIRVLTNSLSDYMKVDKDYLTEIVCKDEVDIAILHCLWAAGSLGLSPKRVVQDPMLSDFKLKRYHITRRIQRMNKRLTAELDKPVAEKRGRRWAMTSFAEKAWGATKEEIVKMK